MVGAVKPKDLAAYQVALAKAGLWSMVHTELTAARFELADLLGHGRDVARLNRLRFRIWRMARTIKDPTSREPMYSFTELGRLFNRDHSSIMSGVNSFDATR